MPRKLANPIERIDKYIEDQNAKREIFWAQRRGKSSTVLPRPFDSNSGDSLPRFRQRASARQAPAQEVVGPSGRKPTGRFGTSARNLVYELQAIKAVKGREDALLRLQICTEKVESGAEAGFMNLNDPLVKMFYRLVMTLRQRTLDAVECVAAWERLVGQNRPFIYRGCEYLPGLGPALQFLDDSPFVRAKMRSVKATEDVFLTNLTPDGIPIEEASTIALRTGGRINPVRLCKVQK